MTDIDINDNSSDLLQGEDEFENDELNYEHMMNYKGYFVEECDEEEEEEAKFFEHGAHFPYSFLYHKLEILYQEQAMNDYKNNYKAIIGENKKKKSYNQKTEEDMQDNNSKDKENSIFELFNHNERSRNRNYNNPEAGKRHNNERDSVKTHNAPILISKLNHQMETKQQVNEAVLPHTKTDFKSILFSIVKTKLKVNNNFNFSKKKMTTKGKLIPMKTVQYVNKKPKNNELTKSQNKDNQRAKSKEVSVTSNKDTTSNIQINNNANTNQKKTKTVPSKNIPKTLINFITNIKIKQRLSYSPAIKKRNPTVGKDRTKKEMAKTDQLLQQRKEKGFVFEQSKQKLGSSLDKNKKQKQKIDYRHLDFGNDHNSRCQTQSNIYDKSNYNKQLLNLRLKNIQDILLSISHANNNNNQRYISRNIPLNSTALISKSKHCPQNNLTQEPNNNDINHLFFLTNNDKSNQFPNNNFLRTTMTMIKRPKAKAKSKPKAPNQTIDKIKTYFEMKYSLNPKTKANILNKIENSIGISSILLKTKSKYVVKKVTKNQHNNSKKKKKEINTMSKGSTNLPGSSSSITTTNKHSSSIQKGSNVTNSKTSLISKETKHSKIVIRSYLNSFNKCSKKSPNY